MFWKVRKAIANFIVNPRAGFMCKARPTCDLNLAGDRDIENAWIFANLPNGSGRVLDFGSGFSSLGLVAAMKGYRVTAIDLREIDLPYVHPSLSNLRGDILDCTFDDDSFDFVINCSSIEHVGLSGRYGVDRSMDEGDIQAMRKLTRLLRPGGSMLLTIPVGRDAVFAPYFRVYGEVRLPLLLQGLEVEREAYWVKNMHNQWVGAQRTDALNQQAYATSEDPMQTYYGIGCFVLRKNILMH